MGTTLWRARVTDRDKGGRFEPITFLTVEGREVLEPIGRRWLELHVMVTLLAAIINNGNLTISGATFEKQESCASATVPSSRWGSNKSAGRHSPKERNRFLIGSPILRV
jgi:hypothetical protein